MIIFLVTSFLFLVIPPRWVREFLRIIYIIVTISGFYLIPVVLDIGVQVVHVIIQPANPMSALIMSILIFMPPLYGTSSSVG